MKQKQIKVIEWTKKEDALLTSCMNKMSYENMEKLFPGRTKHSIRARAYRVLGLINNYKHKIHSKNESFWETPNPINCYVAGFCAADAYVCEKKGHEAFKLGISIKDEKHIQKFKELFEYTGQISKVQKRFGGNDSSPWTTLVCLQINSCKKWIEDMKRNFNICQGKSKILKGPNLTNEYLMMCFLCGFIDGDGSVVWDKWKKQPAIKLFSSSNAILEWAHYLIDKHFNFSARTPKKIAICARKNKKMSSLNVSGLRAAKMFELLSTMDIPKLDRKWKNPQFLAEFENYKLKFPTFFTDEAKQRFDIEGNLISLNFTDFRQLNALKIASKPAFSVAVTHSF